MSNPKFSIIIPTYNRAEFIEKTINSVLNQTYENFEIIIVDDGSTDNTKEIVTSINDKRIKYYRKENAERGAARNFGVKKAQGDYITFLDSDDVLYPIHFQEAYNLILSNNTPNIFHLAYEIKSENGKILNKINNRKGNLNKLILYGNLLSCIGVFIKKEILDKISFKTDRNLSGTEDWLLWLQLSARNTFKYSNTVTACIINHKNRSVNIFNEQSLNNRTNLLIKYLKEDFQFTSKFGSKIRNIHAHMLSYTALHAALANKKRIAIKYLVHAILKNPYELIKKRTLVIIKKILLS
ncbi:MAG: glycosyltransferase [Chlorobi bacterium]|nr:glycosyltransferase [Chlorobiota bacterium]